MQEENKTLKTRTTDLNTNYLTAEAQKEILQKPKEQKTAKTS